MSVSSQQRPGLHRYAIAAAVCGLLAVLSGTIVTSSGGAGQGFQQIHEIIASVASVVIAILAIWMIRKPPAGSVGWTKSGWTLLATLLAEGALGPLQQTPSAGILHALLGQILFALTVAAAVCTGSAWAKEPDLVEDHGWPSLGSLGKDYARFRAGADRAGSGVPA